MIRAVWRSMRMRPGPSLLLATLVAAATIVMTGAFTAAAGNRDGAPSTLGRVEATASGSAHALVLGFGVLVGFGLALSVAKAFSTSLRRRTGTLALLRATGASSAMLLGAALAQALAIGLLGAALGLLGTLGAPHLPTAGLTPALAPTWDSGQTLMAQEFAIGAGLLATLVGALPSALRAAATPPVPPTPTAWSPQRTLPARGVVGVILIVLGAVGAAGVWRVGDLPQRTGVLGAAAGALFVGLLVSLPTTTHPLIAVLGLPARLASSGRLAARHLAATPSEAAAIAAAPMLATAATCVGAPIAISLRTSSAKDAIPELVAAPLEVLPTLMICIAALAGLCAAGALAVSAAERADESALMGAMGMSRGQRTAQLLCEFVLASAAGVLLGAATGPLLAGATGAVLAEQGLGTLTIPWRQLLLLLTIGCGVGVLSALGPALRVSSPPDQSGSPT